MTDDLKKIIEQCQKNGTHKMEKTFMVISASNGNFRIWSCNSCNLEESRLEYA